MATTRIGATASLGIKRGLEGKKGWGKYDSASPHHSFTIERVFDKELSDEEIEAKSEILHKIAEKKVQQKINEEIQRINEMP